MRLVIVLIIVIAICCYSEVCSVSNLKAFIKTKPVVALAIVAIVLFAGSRAEGIVTRPECTKKKETYCPKIKDGKADCVGFWSKLWYDIIGVFGTKFSTKCCGTGYQLMTNGKCEKTVIDCICKNGTPGIGCTKTAPEKCVAPCDSTYKLVGGKCVTGTGGSNDGANDNGNGGGNGNDN
jgi:hypothetical protein